MDVKMRKSFVPLDEEQLLAAERDLGVQFPPEYRRFLADSNGGKPQPDGFFYKRSARKEAGMVDWFLGIHDGEYDNLRRYAENYKLRIPAHLLPIAHDPGGNLICIAVSGAERGSVYFWDHEQEAADGLPPSADNVYLIAPGFSAFLASLTLFA